MDKYYYHFTSDAMAEQVKKFLKVLDKGNDKEKEWLTILKSTVQMRQAELQNQESMLFLAKQIIGESAKLKGKNVKTPKKKEVKKVDKDESAPVEEPKDAKAVDFLEVNLREFAEQIVLLDCALFSSLQPGHLLGDLGLSEDLREIQHVKDQSHAVRHLTPTLPY